MTRHWTGLAAVLAVAAVRLCPATAAEAPPTDFSAKVAAVVRHLADARPEDPAVWAGARKLRAMGRDALPALRKAAETRPSVAAQLALGWALLSLHDFRTGVAALRSVVAGKAGRPAKLAAARVLGEVGRDAAEVELTRLLGVVRDDRVRVALAKALSQAATTEAAEAKATTTLVRLVRTAGGEGRAAAALALAELDDFRSPVPKVLADLAVEPTDRGRLAAKLLELHRLSEAMLRPDNYKGGLGHPLLDEIKNYILRYHIDPPKDPRVLIDAAARGMTAALHKTDPYSTYLSKRDWDEFRQQISGTYGGIGAHVAFLKDDRTGEKVFTAVKPIYTGPAYKAGLRSYDQIIEIDGESVKGKTLLELRNLLRGLPESVVAVKVRRRAPKKDRELLLKIVRGSVTLPTVRHELLPGGIGYLRLDSFGDTSSAEVETALREMEKAGMKALIFDLRGNPGGLLLAARDIADKFLKHDRLIVYSEGRNKKIAPRKELRTTDPATHPDYPMVVLVDGRSASASEIVSGALQDHKRAVILGERTWGKGSVQQLIRLNAAGRQAILKLTVARYFLPSGRSIHRSAGHRGGIVPDIPVPFEATWTRDHFERNRAAGDFYRYSFVHWPKHKKTLMKLAEFDNADPARYPGFDEWYDGLRVKTDRDTARRLLRQWLRVLTADERGRDWAADLEEDNQLQRAVYEVGRKIPGLDLKAVPRYRNFVVRFGKKKAAGPAGR